MNEERDQDVVRLLREYQEELRSASPPTPLLAKIQAEARRAAVAPVVPLRSRWRSPGVWSGLAVAASLLVAIAVYRNRTEPVAAPVQMAKVEAPTSAAFVGNTASPAAASGEPAPPAKRAEAPAPPKPSIDPSAPPSIRAALEAAAPAEPERLSVADRAAAAPPAEAKVSESLAAADVATAEAPKVAVVEKLAEKKPAAHSVVLHATVVREVFDPGQLARVFTGTFSRLGDGTESTSVLAPADVPAMTQNALAVAPASQSQAPAGLARSSREQLRAPAPVRDQIAEARKKLASPQTVNLGAGIIEGYRCVGTRVLDGQRAVERWHSPELGLDLLVRTTEASGAQVVVRYVNIEKK